MTKEERKKYYSEWRKKHPDYDKKYRESHKKEKAEIGKRFRDKMNKKRMPRKCSCCGKVKEWFDMHINRCIECDEISNNKRADARRAKRLKDRFAFGNLPIKNHHRVNNTRKLNFRDETEGGGGEMIPVNNMEDAIEA